MSVRDQPERRASKAMERIVGALGILLILATWELASRTNLIDARIFPAPTAVIVTIGEMYADQDLLTDTLYTLTRFLIGTVVGAVPGVFIGLTMGLFRWVGAVLRPINAALYNVPRIALFPLVLITVGLNETSNIIMIALGPFFAMLITAMGAVTNVEQIYRDVAKNFGAGTRHLYLLVTLPAIAPALMDGLRISLGLGLLGTTAVEFLVANGGIGHVIWNSWQIMSLKQSMAGLILVAIIGYVFYQSVTWLERRLIPWQEPAAFQ
jgi:ABC-type nitrate/sulfonate/bicarbonate transport system permease component